MIASVLPNPVVPSMAAVAQWFRVDVRTVQNWKLNGMPCGDGNYNLQDITEWCRGRLDRRAAPAASASETDMEQEEYLDKQAVRQMRQAKYAAFIGRLVEKSLVVSLLANFAAIVRARLQAIPGELAASIPPEHRHDLMIELEQKIVLILTEMSAWVLPSSLKTISTSANGSEQQTSKKSGEKPAKSSPPR